MYDPMLESVYSNEMRISTERAIFYIHYIYGKLHLFVHFLHIPETCRSTLMHINYALFPKLLRLIAASNRRNNCFQGYRV